MANATRSQLEQAYNLIQQEQLDKAIAILKPITVSEPKNADAWWLMANAVSEPQDAYEALNKVLELKPNHAEAKELLGTLKEEFPYLAQGVKSGFSDNDPGFDDLFGDTDVSTSTRSSAPADFGTDDLDSLLSSDFPSGDTQAAQPAHSDDLDDLFASDDLFSGGEPQFVQDDALALPEEPAKPAKRGRDKAPKAPKAAKEPKAPKPVPAPLTPLEMEEQANRRTNPFMLAAIVLFVVVIAGAVVIGLFVTGVLGGQNNNALNGLFADTNNQMSQSGFKSPNAAVVDSSLGKTFMVRTCSTSGPDLPDKINKAMDISAKAAATVKDTVQAAGIQIVSCTKPDVTLYRAIAPIAQVLNYVNGNLADTHAFRSSWVKN